MKFNNFQVEPDTNSWVLIETKIGTSKDGTEIPVESRTYHATLKQALIYALDQGLKDKSADTILSAIKEAETNICQSVSSNAKSVVG
jgi:hypothetical protein